MNSGLAGVLVALSVLERELLAFAAFWFVIGLIDEVGLDLAWLWLRLGRGEEQTGGRTRLSTLGDALEAVIGAAYLDGGMKAVERIFDRLFTGLLPRPEGALPEENPKGALQEYCQRRWKTGPSYRLLGEEGPAHARSFTVGVEVGGRLVGQATALSKREAEIQAAREALRRKEEFPDEPGGA